MFRRMGDSIPGSDNKNDHVRRSPLHPHFCNVDAYTLRPRIRGITQIPPSNFALWGGGGGEAWMGTYFACDGRF